MKTAISSTPASFARVVVITAEPDGATSALADELLVIPAQTMANDVGSDAVLLALSTTIMPPPAPSVCICLYTVPAAPSEPAPAGSPP